MACEKIHNLIPPMPTRFIHRVLRNTLHRWPAKLVLLGYVWMCCGGTMPATLLLSSESLAKAMSKDRSVPFPCMDKACGCRTAEQCFKSCCCSTKAERIAWAKDHAVAAEYVALAEQAEDKPAAKSCCASKATSSRSCCKPVVKTTSCCEKPAPQKKCCEQKSEPAPSEQRPAPGFSMLAAMKCAGLQIGAMGVPMSLPLDLELVLPLEAPLVGRVVELAPTFSSPIDTPDGPPPRG